MTRNDSDRVLYCSMRKLTQPQVPFNHRGIKVKNAVSPTSKLHKLQAMYLAVHSLSLSLSSPLFLLALSTGIAPVAEGIRASPQHHRQASWRSSMSVPMSPSSSPCSSISSAFAGIGRIIHDGGLRNPRGQEGGDSGRGSLAMKASSGECWEAGGGGGSSSLTWIRKDVSSTDGRLKVQSEPFDGGRVLKGLHKPCE